MAAVFTAPKDTVLTYTGTAVHVIVFEDIIEDRSSSYAFKFGDRVLPNKHVPQNVKADNF